MASQTPETLVEALAYYRTSSATNVGPDKDSQDRQRAAVATYAAAEGIRVVGEYSDPAVSGDDPIDTRPGFAALLARIQGNGVRLVLVESADRFARHMLTAELGLLMLKRLGVRVVTASGQDLTDTDDPSKVMIRQIMLSFSQFEKARLVAKLRHARVEKGKLGGRPRVTGPVVDEARRLARKSPKTGEARSLREIAAELASLGHLAPSGKAYGHESVKRMLSEASRAARTR